MSAGGCFGETGLIGDHSTVAVYRQPGSRVGEPVALYGQLLFQAHAQGAGLFGGWLVDGVDAVAGRVFLRAGGLGEVLFGGFGGQGLGVRGEGFLEAVQAASDVAAEPEGSGDD